jgi:hypothetical protein
MFERLNFVCTSCPIKDSARTGTHIFWLVATVFQYLCFGKKSFNLSNTERRPDMLLRCSDGCNREQFKASGHRGMSGLKVLVVRTDDTSTNECLDGISRPPDECKGTELYCFESCSLLEAHN